MTMGNRNAYFGLSVKDGRTYLYLVPAVGGTSKIEIKEIEEYLTARKIDYNIDEIISAIITFTERKVILLANREVFQEDESVSIVVSNDKLKVMGRFYPPTEKGRLLAKEDIIASMVSRGVKFGANEANIQRFLSDREYCTDYELATATLPVEGRNAQIKLYFNTDTTTKPKTLEDGSVDFHQLNNIVHVNKDDLLAELIPAENGKRGINVIGVPMNPAPVSSRTLKYGKNIRINEEKTKIYSMVDGHVSLVDGYVQVSDIYVIAQDVDASTGDITYEGNVQINGNVRTGYKVFAKGDIIVNGVVEGATLDAGGQIIVKRGIQGMNKALLRAKTNIITKFIESSEVIAGGYITTETILHSTVEALGDITVNGKRGFISGGAVRSGTSIHAKTAGSTMGTNTMLEVGVSPMLLEEGRRIEKDIPALEAEMLRSIQKVDVYKKRMAKGEKLTPDKLADVKNTLNSIKDQEAKLNKMKLRLEELQVETESHNNGNIRIIDAIYPGCQISISGVVQFIKTVSKHCRFVKEGADIKLTYY